MNYRKQQVPHSGTKQAAVAQRLISASTVATHILRQTFTIDDIPAVKQEIPDHMDAYFISCDLVAGRYYLVTHDVLVDRWTSTGGAELVGRHVAQIKGYVTTVATCVA